jgi:hypothetical protein
MALRAVPPPTEDVQPHDPETVRRRELEATRQQVYARRRDIIEAQIRSAVGLVHFMKRNPLSGKWERLDDPEEIESVLNDPNMADGTHYHLAVRDPNNAAAALLLAYALDHPKKPSEQVEVTVRDGDLKSRIDAARARVSAAKAVSGVVIARVTGDGEGSK